ncbi:hypothetical protein D3C76_1183410 [compost metagenome]
MGLGGGQQAMAQQRVRRIEAAQELVRLVPQALRQGQAGTAARQVVEAAGDHRPGGAVDARQQRQRQDEALHRGQVQLLGDPAEGAALHFGRIRRHGGGDAFAEVARGDVFGEEGTLVALVAQQVEGGQGAVHRWRQGGLAAALEHAFAPQPADFPTQAQGDLGQPVTRLGILAVHAGEEGHRVGQRVGTERVGHGTTTLGLALACWLLTRRITR